MDLIVDPDSSITILGRFSLAGDTCNMVPWDEWVTRFWKINSMGDTLWTKNIDYSAYYPAGYLLNFSPGGFCRTNNNNFLIVGDLEPGYISMVDAFLMKTDSVGNVLWINEYSGNFLTHLLTVIVTDDQGYLAGGNACESGGYVQNLYLLKTDSSGNKEWDHSYFFGEGFFGDCHSIIDNHNGTYTILGQILPYGATDSHYKFWMLNIDAAGNTLSSHHIGAEIKGQFLSKGIKTWDNKVIMVGVEYDPWRKLCAIKADNNGNLDFYKSYGDSLHSYTTQDVVETSDSGFIIMGGVESCHYDGNMSDCDSMKYFMTKLDKYGNYQWEKIWGDPEDWYDMIYSVKNYSDNSIVAIGTTYWDTYIIRFDSLTNGWTAGIDENPRGEPDKVVFVYPNPVEINATVKISKNCSSPDLNFIVYDVFGRTLSSMRLMGTINNWERKNLPGGIYFYKVSSNKKVISTGKLVLSGL